MPQYTLTISCPDRTGIVAAISNFIADRSGSITEAAHFVDALSQRSFMRTVFKGETLPSLATLRMEFAATAERHGMELGVIRNGAPMQSAGGGVQAEALLEQPAASLEH
jgi:formyltetrahydrofolate hydrolase